MDKLCVSDLTRSGLVPEDIGARDAGAPELAAVKVPANLKGYVIPYYDISGKRLQFYRVRLFEYKVRYMQPSGTANHVYFPPNFATTLQKHLATKPKRAYILLTEGEKKAAAACKAGIPCVALGGVDSWRGRTVILPKATALTQDGNYIRAKIPPGSEITVEEGTKAAGLQGLIDFCVERKITLIIAYDTDGPQGVKMEVQRAAALLGHEAHHNGMGISYVRQLILPYSAELGKVGIDDYIVHKGPKALQNLVAGTLAKRNGFPRLPNAKKFINDKLQSGKLQRDETQMIAAAMLAELDSHGRRIQSNSSPHPYYFDETSMKLLPVQILQSHKDPLHESAFGSHMYKEFGISSADNRVLQWLAAQFTGEDPVEKAEPSRVMAFPPGTEWEIAVQVSDSHFAVITADSDDPFHIYPNGSKGLLFEQGQVEAVDIHELHDAFEEQIEKPLTSWWYEIMSKNFTLKGESSAALMSLMYYISPYLMRWKGTQLPVELLIGEPGSGKSSLYALRLSILTGQPLLRNVPTDIRDWFSSIVSTGGIHVIDNVQFTNKELRQRISDEICRIVTEPEPHIEMRRLFTTNSMQQVPVNVIFAMTAVQQPFYNSDLLQRAAVFELDAIRSGHTSDWVRKQLDAKGGRVAWMAHHFVVLHKFLNLAKEEWDENYIAGHRLANYEQCLALMSQVLNTPLDGKAAPKDQTIERKQELIKKSLAASTEKTILNSDWAFSGMKKFLSQCQDNQELSVTAIYGYFAAHEDYHDHPILTQPRALTAYLMTNRTMLFRTIGLKDATPDTQQPGDKKYIVRPSNNR